MYILLLPPKFTPNKLIGSSSVLGFVLCNPVWVNNQAGPSGPSKAHFPILRASCADLFIWVNNPPLISPSVALSTKSPTWFNKPESEGLGTSGNWSAANKPLYK